MSQHRPAPGSPATPAPPAIPTIPAARAATSEIVIGELVDATCGVHASARTRHILREALRGLVRLAKVEQLMAMRLDAERAAGGMTATSQRRQTKALLRKIGMDVGMGRERFAADWDAAPRAPGGLTARAARVLKTIAAKASAAEVGTRSGGNLARRPQRPQ